MSFKFVTLKAGSWDDSTVWHTAKNFTSPPSGAVVFIADTENIDEFPASCPVVVGGDNYAVVSVTTTGGQHEITLDNSVASGTTIRSADLPNNNGAYDTQVEVWHNLTLPIDTGSFTNLVVASSCSLTVSYLSRINCYQAIVGNDGSIIGARFAGGSSITPAGDNCTVDLSYCDFDTNVYLNSNGYSGTVFNVNTSVNISASGGAMVVDSGSDIICLQLYLRNTNCHFDNDTLFDGSIDIGSSSTWEINSGYVATITASTQTDDGSCYVNGEFVVPVGANFSLTSNQSGTTNFYISGNFYWSNLYGQMSASATCHKMRKSANVVIQGMPVYFDGALGANPNRLGI